MCIEAAGKENITLLLKAKIYHYWRERLGHHHEWHWIMGQGLPIFCLPTCVPSGCHSWAFCLLQMIWFVRSTFREAGREEGGSWILLKILTLSEELPALPGCWLHQHIIIGTCLDLDLKKDLWGLHALASAHIVDWETYSSWTRVIPRDYFTFWSLELLSKTQVLTLNKADSFFLYSHTFLELSK